MKVCIAPSRVLSSVSMGGHPWVYANWSLGLRANGCDVYWIERFDPDESPDRACFLLEKLHRQLHEINADVPVALILSEEQERRFADSRQRIDQLTVPLELVLAECDLLMNFYYELEPTILRRFSKTALMDIDPGLLQYWMSQHQLQVADHDLYFTIGETVGGANAKFPDCGVSWQHTPPPVCLQSWPVAPVKAESAYTTVSSWWAEWECLDGKTFSNEKRTSFLDYITLPSRCDTPLELALCMSDSKAEREDKHLLESHGWNIKDAAKVCGTPQQYHGYVQQSRGEFSCAKPSCISLSNAWISDRTLCYLASGKPAIVQYTGPSKLLPEACGLFRFRTMEQAQSALKETDSDYDRHCREARSLAVEHFDARRVTGRVLERAV